MKTKLKLITVYVVLFDASSAGPAGDGAHTRRFQCRADADAFAKTRTCYGQPASVQEDNVPRALAQRWGVA